MKALLLSTPGTLALADVDTPPPALGEVLVRIAACGICGSDVHDSRAARAGASDKRLRLFPHRRCRPAEL